MLAIVDSSVQLIYPVPNVRNPQCNLLNFKHIFFRNRNFFLLLKKRVFSIVIFPRLVLDIPMMLLKSSVKQRYRMFFAFHLFCLLVNHEKSYSMLCCKYLAIIVISIIIILVSVGLYSQNTEILSPLSALFLIPYFLS